MKKFLFGAFLALLSAALAPASGLAADSWVLDTSVAGAPKAKVSATLTFTEVSQGKAVTVKYKPGAARVRIERNVDGDIGKHTASIQLTQGADAGSLSLSAGMLGSGLKVVNSTSVVAGINPETDTDNPFSFSDNGAFHSMSAANVMASSAEGKYDEVVEKTSGLPAGPINLSLTFTIVGNLDTGQPAKIVVKVSAKNVQPETTQ